MLTNIIDLFEEGALKKCPEKVALIEEERSITFNSLSIYSKQIASVLASIINYDINRCIGVCCRTGIDILSADLGIMYSGNHYTNIDMKFPIKKLEIIVNNITPDLFIVDNEGENYLKQLDYDCKFLNISEIGKETIMDSKALLYNKNIDTDLMCIMNTSGSTGVPKSTVITHRGMIDYAYWAFDTMKFTGEEISGVLPAFYFDGYLTAFFNCIYNGATFVIAPNKIVAFPAKLAEYFSKHNITFIFWVPSVLSMFVNGDILGRYDLSSLKIVCFAGEVFPVPHYKYWKSKIPNAAFINLYGPIEISVICTYYIVDREIKDDETIPIGKGCKNSDVFLLKEDNTKANIGEEGEICIRGSSLSFGYINNFEKTNNVFVQNPLNTKYPELIYKTGDIGRLDNDENIIFIGRKDFQIKHMGYRIELGEIEHFASNIDGINHVCVLYDKDNKSIIMVYEAENEISVSNIRNYLLENIPKYALPTVYKYVKELPRNANGKIDRQLLKEIYIQTVKDNKFKQSFRGGVKRYNNILLDSFYPQELIQKDIEELSVSYL